VNFESMFKKQQTSLAKQQIQRKKFKTGKLELNWPATPEQTAKDYRVITTREELIEYLNRCKETGYCSFDWETGPSELEHMRWENEVDELMTKRDFIEDNMKMAAQTGTKTSLNALKKALNEHDKYFETRQLYHDYSPLDPHRADICTVSLSAAPHEARVLFLSHEEGTQHYLSELCRDNARDSFLKDFECLILRDTNVKKIAYNLNFETKMAMKYGIYIGMPAIDPFVMIVRTLQAVNPKEIEDPKMPAKGKGLKQMTLKYLKVQMSEFTSVVEDAGVNFFNEVSTDYPNAIKYSAEDSDYSLQLYLYFNDIAKQVVIERELVTSSDLIDRYGSLIDTVEIYNKPYGNYSEWLHAIEMPFARVIGQMEYHGFTWNEEKAHEVKKTAENAMEAAKLKIRHIGQKVFNEMQEEEPNNPMLNEIAHITDIDPGKTGKNSSVRFLLFDVLGCPQPTLSEKTGKANMDHNSILDMKFMVTHNLTTLDDEECVDVDIPESGSLTPVQIRAQEILNSNPYKYKNHILELLEAIEDVQKFGVLLSSHIYGREKFLHPMTGRIHARFTPWTETSRLNSSQPNGQNVPRPDTDEFGIRNVYQAAANKVLLLIDYSGFELRLMAWASKDQNMLDIFNNDGDMHRRTAATLTGKKEDDITKEERISAKSGNFGIGYCGTAWALQRTYKRFGNRKSIEFCDKVVQAVKKTYPRIVEWQLECAAKSRRTGYAETIFGYRRVLPNINSINHKLRAADERRASNTPIQGSAADIMKKSQNAIYDKIAEDTWNERYDGVPSLFVHGRVDQIQQFHDELVMEVDNDPAIFEPVVEWIINKMQEEPVPNFPLQLIADPEIAFKGWGDKEDYWKWLKQYESESK